MIFMYTGSTLPPTSAFCSSQKDNGTLWSKVVVYTENEARRFRGCLNYAPLLDLQKYDTREMATHVSAHGKP